MFRFSGRHWILGWAAGSLHQRVPAVDHREAAQNGPAQSPAQGLPGRLAGAQDGVGD